MGRLLLRRLASAVVLVLAAGSLAYLLAASSLDPRSNFEQRQPPPSAATVSAQLAALNLDDREPLLARYATWLGSVLRGDFGRTIHGAEIGSELGRRIGVSLRLLLAGTLLGGLLGVLLGALAAVRQYRLSDQLLGAGAFLILSVPVFVLAVLLEVAAIQLNTAVGSPVLLYTGEFSPEVTGTWAVLVDRLQHLVLPTLTVALGEIAILLLYQRSAMLDVLGGDFVRTARAKGLRRRPALLRHALRTALVPSVTYFAFGFTLLLTGAMFAEKIFAWHGVGEWFIDSVGADDVNVIAAVSVLSAVLVVLAGVLADVAYALLDPRMRVQAGAR